MHFNNASKILAVMTLLVVSLFLGCKEKKTRTEQETTQKTADSETIELLIGTYTQTDSKGIYKMTFDEESGQLSDLKLVAETENPSFLCTTQDKQTVYSVNEVKNGSITSFKWDESRSQLTPISQKPTDGNGPCHITLNKAQNLVAASNYGSGTFTLYRTNAEGQLLGEPQVRNHKGSGPVLPAQASARAHYSMFGPNDRFVYVADLGIDKVIAYPIAEDGTLGKEQTALQMDAGDGPRHMVFHPTKNMVFIINEHSNSVVSATVDYDSGLFTRIDKKRTLPENYGEPSYCADIHISGDGKFLYGSNRGHNSIAVFSVSGEGQLELIDNISVEGDWPRNFTLSPNGDYMLVANQKSNNITVFKMDKTTGLPTFTGQEVKVSMPVCLKFREI